MLRRSFFGLIGVTLAVPAAFVRRFGQRPHETGWQKGEWGGGDVPHRCWTKEFWISHETFIPSTVTLFRDAYQINRHSYSGAQKGHLMVCDVSESRDHECRRLKVSLLELQDMPWITAALEWSGRRRKPWINTLPVQVYKEVDFAGLFGPLEPYACHRREES